MFLYKCTTKGTAISTEIVKVTKCISILLSFYITILATTTYLALLVWYEQVDKVINSSPYIVSQVS